MKRFLFVVLGIFFLLLGYLGVIIPGLPATPFLILAAACFVKSSPKLHKWLLASKVFGPIISNWEKNRSISKKAKITALVMMFFMGMASIIIIKNIYVKVIVSIFLLYGLYFMSRIKETDCIASK